MRNHDDLWSAEQLAEYLGLKPNTIREWGRLGRIPRLSLSHKVIRYRPTDVITSLEQRGCSEAKTPVGVTA